LNQAQDPREILIKLTELEQAIDIKLCEQSLYHFVKRAWNILEPDKPFVDGWHTKAFCEHLEAVTLFVIPRLLINVPPRHAKSIISTVLWPAWVWIKYPQRRFIFASYSASLAMRDSVKCRQVIESDWYRQTFKIKWALADDQNTKSKFMNSEQGFRYATSVGGTLTGEGGDYLVADDPLNVMDAYSEPARQEAWRWWSQSMSTRANDPNRVGRVVIMQRLHEDDPSGHILKIVEPELRYDLLILPAEYDIKRASQIKPTTIGWRDPRTKDGELLWPERFSAANIRELKSTLGTQAASGQLNQDPIPGEGGIFKRKDWKWYKIAPTEIEMIVQIWDCAESPGVSNDYSVCTTWAFTSTRAYALDLWRDKVEAPQLNRVARSQYGKFKPDIILIEKKSHGTQLIQTLQQDQEQYYPVVPYNPKGVSKLTRAVGATPMVENGSCYLPEYASWTEDFILEHEKFPLGAHDDQVDTTSMMADHFRKVNNFNPRASQI
jgi:predicted phage terminase large subunit-like protein